MSLRRAINRKCRECIYEAGSGAGTWRQQVSCCTARSCPLFPVRPMPKPDIGIDLIVPKIPVANQFNATVDRVEVSYE
jgi:hypothetical protein